MANPDFIGIYRDVFADGFCQHLIDEFERNVSAGAGVNRQQGEGALRHEKDDYQLFCNGANIDWQPFNGQRTVDVFFAGLQACFDDYANQFSVIRDNPMTTRSMKLQRTVEGGGYHRWHCEQGGGESANRALVYMLYLNSLAPDQCGETEFIYQQRRIQPTENTMLLWPAAFTHAHRGNPVYAGGKKYIVTGWFKLD